MDNDEFIFGLIIGFAVTFLACMGLSSLIVESEKNRQFKQNPEAYCQLLPTNSSVPYGCIKYLNK